MWPDRGEEIRTLPMPRVAHPAFACDPIAWRFLVSNASALYRLRKARILGREGTVISPDNRVIERFTYTDREDNLASHPIFRRRRFPKPRSLKGTYATITYPSSFAWYHWVTESLPRLRLLQPWLDAIDGLFVPADTEPQIQESLEAMGLRHDQLIPLSIADHFEPEYLLVPHYCAGLNIPSWVPQYLQESVGLLPCKSLPPKRKLYISRADANKRRILNETQLLPLLKQAGFEIICLRNYSFREQITMFQQAAWVIAPHGAGLANVLYCGSGVQVIEITPCHTIGPHLFHSITTCVGGTYWWLPGEPSPPHGKVDVHVDFNVDPKLFQEALRHTGADQ
jgi:capsular polysaccharide biosynthesis protein